MKRLFILGAAITLTCGMLLSNTALAAEETQSTDIGEMLGSVKEKLSDALAEQDPGTVKEMFSFASEKLQDGSLETDEGLADAIDEGEEKFGVTIDEEDAKKVVETMEKLEDMGFSGEYILDKAEDLYDEYGADFVDHSSEIVKDAVEDAVETAAKGFFSSLWDAVKSFFAELCGKLKLTN